jgi:hypothetical protein
VWNENGKAWTGLLAYKRKSGLNRQLVNPG